MLVYGLARKFGDLDKLIVNSNSYYCNEQDNLAQKMKIDGKKPVITKYPIQSSDDIKQYLENLGLSDEIVNQIEDNCDRLFNRFNNFNLHYDYQLVKYDNPEKIVTDLIKKNGRLKDDPVYRARLKEEWDVICNNGVINLLPYFIPITEVYEHYDKKGLITGVARGSGGGSLLSYLIGITHVDPIKYELSFSRFLTLDRVVSNHLPDLDCDLISRDLLVGSDGNSGFLRERFGDCYAQCSTRTLLRLKSAMLDANRFINGEMQDDVIKLSKSLPPTPQGLSDYKFIFGYEKDGVHIPGVLEKNEDLQKYTKERPDEWEIVKRALSLSRQNSRHACAFILASKPIVETVPLMEVGGTEQVTQPEHKQCESAGLIKYDFLTITSALYIDSAIKFIREKQNCEHLPTGYFMHNGKETFIWELPEEACVFDDLSNRKTAGVFQFSSQTMTEFLHNLKPETVLDLAATNALNRPGPLDFIDESTGRNMAEEFIERKNGRSVGEIEVLNSMLSDTYGVITFQEDITKIAKELAGMNVEDSENLRIAVGKKKMDLMNSLKPVFIEGASKKIQKHEAEKLWDMIVTFGRYGFNKCLHGDTLVKTALGGEVCLRSLHLKGFEGKILAPDGCGGFCFRKVKHIHFNGIRSKTLKITLENGVGITVTHNHQLKKGALWAIAGELSVGDKLNTVNGRVAISDITEIIGIQTVYDVEMEDSPHAFVANGIVSHNSHSVAYSIVGYACAFLKHHYNLEWWAGVISNCSNTKINEEYYKHIQDIVRPPDINLSSDTVTIDYNSGHIRYKLSVIKGMGEKTAAKIIENRPYKDLTDFVERCGVGIKAIKRLALIGVIDSFFDKNTTLMKKIYEIDKSFIVKEKNKKIEEYDLKIKGLENEKDINRVLKNKQRYIDKPLKEVKVDEEFLRLSPLDIKIMQKQLLPAFPINLTETMIEHSKHIYNKDVKPLMLDKKNNDVEFISGVAFKEIEDRMPFNGFRYWVVGYILECSVFSYHNGEQQAFKMNIDNDGIVSERVLWPDYNTKKLTYDKSIKKGSIVALLLYKSEGKDYINIIETKKLY